MPNWVYSSNGTSPVSGATTPAFVYGGGKPLYSDTHKRGYREMGQELYGSQTTYGQALDASQKADLISKLGGPSNSLVFGGKGGSGQAMISAYRHALGDQPAEAPGKNILGMSLPASSTPEARRSSFMSTIRDFAANRADAERASNQEYALNKLYDNSLKKAFSLQGVKDQATLDQLGEAGPQREWREVMNNITGESGGYYAEDQKSGRGGALEQNFKRNTAAYTAALGAILGFVTGGPVGAVVGGTAGYTAGKSGQDANRQAYKLRDQKWRARQELKAEEQQNKTLAQQLAKRGPKGAGEAAIEYADASSPVGPIVDPSGPPTRTPKVTRRPGGLRE